MSTETVTTISTSHPLASAYTILRESDPPSREQSQIEARLAKIRREYPQIESLLGPVECTTADCAVTAIGNILASDPIMRSKGEPEIYILSGPDIIKQEDPEYIEAHQHLSELLLYYIVATDGKLHGLDLFNDPKKDLSRNPIGSAIYQLVLFGTFDGEELDQFISAIQDFYIPPGSEAPSEDMILTYLKLVYVISNALNARRVAFMDGISKAEKFSSGTEPDTHFYNLLLEILEQDKRKLSETDKKNSRLLYFTEHTVLGTHEPNHQLTDAEKIWWQYNWTLTQEVYDLLRRMGIDYAFYQGGSKTRLKHAEMSDQT